MKRKKPSYSDLKRRVRELERLLQDYKEDAGESVGWAFIGPYGTPGVLSVGMTPPEDLVNKLPDTP